MFFPWRLHAQTEQLLVFIKILVHLLLIFEKSLSKLVTDEYPTTRGKKVTGEWKDGEQLNTNHYNKVGDIIGQWLNGVEQYVVLFGRIVNGNVEWSENRGENYTMKYIGETKNEKPHGKGTGTSSKGKKYIGKWKNGVPHGQGEYTYSNGEKYAG